MSAASGRIRGDLRVLGLANLLQAISLNRLSGVLALSTEGRSKAIYLGPDGIRLLASHPRRGQGIGTILLRTGRITPAQMETILAQQANHERIGEVVARMGLVSKKDIEQALREQAEEEIYELFAWTDAAFEFVEGTPAKPATPSPLSAVTLPPDVTTLLLEAARRADEIFLIREAIPSDDMIPVRLEGEAVIESINVEPEVCRAVVGLVDGRRSVAQLLEACWYPRFTALRTLYALTVGKLLKITDRKGATVILKEKPPEAAAARPAPPAEAPAASGRWVLILSDLPHFRTALGQMLRGNGYDVMGESCSADLGQTFGRHRFDAVILDVSLMTPNAYGLCANVARAGKSPVIMLNANSGRDAVVLAIRSGARDYLVKPFANETLLERLRQVVK